jgi:hypothetical protein
LKAIDRIRNPPVLAIVPGLLLATGDDGFRCGGAFLSRTLPPLPLGLCRSAGTFAVLVGKADTAARLLSCFEALREQIGVSEAWVARMNEQTLSAIRARLDEGAFAEAWEHGQALTIDEAVALALECSAALGRSEPRALAHLNAPARDSVKNRMTTTPAPARWHLAIPAW